MGKRLGKMWHICCYIRRRPKNEFPFTLLLFQVSPLDEEKFLILSSLLLLSWSCFLLRVAHLNEFFPFGWITCRLLFNALWPQVMCIFFSLLNCFFNILSKWYVLFQLVQGFVRRRADINLKSSDGFLPLCLASFWGHDDIVKILLEKGWGIPIILDFSPLKLHYLISRFFLLM